VKKIPLLGQEGAEGRYGLQGVVDRADSLPSWLTRDPYHPRSPGGLHPLLK
jgi:hypothetical protein